MSRKMSLKELDFNNIGGWPREFKMVFCALLAVLIIALTWWFFVRDQREQLRSLENQERDLRAQFEDKQGRAANLEPLKLQLVRVLDRALHILQPGQDILGHRGMSSGSQRHEEQPGEHAWSPARSRATTFINHNLQPLLASVRPQLALLTLTGQYTTFFPDFSRQSVQKHELQPVGYQQRDVIPDPA